MILDSLDTYLLIKALHLIFVITWFAGLFYIPRLFVYHIEALDQPEAAQAYVVPQLQLMTRRLWNIITWPSAILATGFCPVASLPPTHLSSPKGGCTLNSSL